MGKRGNWFIAVKKAFSHESKEKKYEKTSKSKKKWGFGKEKHMDPSSSTIEIVSTPPPLPSDEVKLTEAENEQTKHAYSVALATAVAAEAAVAAAEAAAEVVRLTNVRQYSGKSREEVAAIKIQTAFRGYLIGPHIAHPDVKVYGNHRYFPRDTSEKASVVPIYFHVKMCDMWSNLEARRALRALRGLVRLKTLIDGHPVKRQATTTLRCMQTLARVQSQIRARRIRMSEENQALQRQLQQKCEKELEKLRMGEDWDDSLRSKEQIEANLLNKQEASIRRERALAYAFSHQQMWKNSSKSTNPTFMDPNNPHWGWSWLERWMAARPWESKSTMEKDLNNDHSSIRSVSCSVGGEISRAYARREVNPDIPSPTSQKPIRSTTPYSPSTPSSKTGKLKSASPRGGLWAPEEDSRSMLSVQSGKHRRHSIAGSSVRDDESLASSPSSVPSYMAPTKSAKAKARLQSPLGIENDEERGSVGSVKKRLSFPGSSGGPRRHSGPPKVDSSSIKDIGVQVEESVSNGAEEKTDR